MKPTLRGFFITGADTEIGKTLITALLTLGLRRKGISCCPVKPIASGGVLADEALVSEDALTYRRLAQCAEPATVLNPLCFRLPASPHFAAESEGRRIDPHSLLPSLSRLAERYEILLVEGVGGWLVPITYEYLVADFARELGLPVILVSANRLGTINHTLLSLASIRAYGLEPAGVMMTKPVAGEPTPMEMNNIETIERIGKIDILGQVPFLEPDDVTGTDQERLWNKIKETIRWERLLQKLHTP
jgi:dethiobiotin synthetase